MNFAERMRKTADEVVNINKAKVEQAAEDDLTLIKGFIETAASKGEYQIAIPAWVFEMPHGEILRVLLSKEGLGVSDTRGFQEGIIPEWNFRDTPLQDGCIFLVSW